MDEKMILSVEDNSDAEIEVGTKRENGETVYFIRDQRIIHWHRGTSTKNPAKRKGRRFQSQACKGNQMSKSIL